MGGIEITEIAEITRNHGCEWIWVADRSGLGA